VTNVGLFTAVKFLVSDYLRVALSNVLPVLAESSRKSSHGHILLSGIKTARVLSLVYRENLTSALFVVVASGKEIKQVSMIQTIMVFRKILKKLPDFSKCPSPSMIQGKICPTV